MADNNYWTRRHGMHRPQQLKRTALLAACAGAVAPVRRETIGACST